MRIIRTTNLAESDIFGVQLTGELIDGFVAPLANRFLHLNLQDQMAAALQIEPKLDAIRNVLAKLSKRRGKLRQGNYSRDAKHDHDGDENKLPLQLGTHAGLLTLFLFDLHTRDGVARDLDFYLLGNPQLNSIVLKADNRAIEA